jgi:hypothetical protein
MSENQPSVYVIISSPVLKGGQKLTCQVRAEINDRGTRHKTEYVHYFIINRIQIIIQNSRS